MQPTRGVGEGKDEKDSRGLRGWGAGLQMYNMTLKILWLPQPLTLAFGMQLSVPVYVSVCRTGLGGIILVIILVLSDSDSIRIRACASLVGPGYGPAKNKFKSHSKSSQCPNWWNTSSTPQPQSNVQFIIANYGLYIAFSAWQDLRGPHYQMHTSFP